MNENIKKLLEAEERNPALKALVAAAKAPEKIVEIAHQFGFDLKTEDLEERGAQRRPDDLDSGDGGGFWDRVSRR